MDPDARPARRLYARIAGGAYLVIVLAAFLYGGLVQSQLIVPSNDAITATNILANPLRFRLGIVLVFVISASVVVASWALFIILRAVHENLALLALLMRMAEAVVGAATVLTTFGVWHVLSADASASAFEPDQLQALAGCLLEARTAGLDILLLFVGVGATIFCYLLFKSRYIPRPLAPGQGRGRFRGMKDEEAINRSKMVGELRPSPLRRTVGERQTVFRRWLRDPFVRSSHYSKSVAPTPSLDRALAWSNRSP